MTTETFDVLFTNEKDKMTTENNPPVFPNKEVNDYGIIIKRQEGISLRDYFANSAMQGLVANHLIVDDVTISVSEWLAIRSYLIADAMLKQR